MKKFYFILVSILLLNSPGNLFSQTVPPGFTVAGIGSGWTEPLGATFSKDGKKIFVWEKAGKVFVCNWNNTTQQYVKQANPVIDISPEVGDWRDFGLVGFAIDPNFDNNGLMYLFYVVDRHYLLNFGTPAYNPASNDYYNATIGRITRYKTVIDGSNQMSADLSTRFILMGETKSAGNLILHESHGVGSLAFASDGTLLASTGDGASYVEPDAGSASETYYTQALSDGIMTDNLNVGAFRSQMLSSLNGKILRIDPATGNGISSNPFYEPGNPKSVKSRVWAMGFRNPFRITIKPNTGSTNPATGDIGEIYVGDVGMNNYEEMDIVEKGGTNFGWPLFEGQTSMAGYTNLNVPNKDEPNPLFGSGGCTQQYFYFQDLIKQATADNNTTVYNPCNSSMPIISGNSNRFFHHRPAIDWRHITAGSRIGIFSGNNAATAQIGSPESGVAGTPFPGNCSVAGTWYTGTSFPAEYQNTYLFADYGVNWLQRATMLTSTQLKQVDPFITGFTAIVCITQNPLDGSIVCVDISAPNPVMKISYGGSQPPIAVASSDKTFGPSVLSVNFTGSNSYDPEGGAITYAWDFGDGNTSTAANPSHNFTSAPNTPKKFVVKLTVKDNMNLSTTDSVIISVNNTPPVVNIISPVKNSRYTVGTDTTYSLLANVTDAEQPDGQLTYQWQTILRHNNHQHPEAIDTNRITSTYISRVGCNGDTYYWLIKLTVTDAAGLSTTDSSKIFPLCPGDIVLPVTLTSFSVNIQGSINNVKWTTEQEVNSKYFVVERSSNGQDFQPINKQAAKNLPGPQGYSFADDKYSLGTNFYRLKMIDINETYSYSKTIKVYNGSGNDDVLRITPNPVSKEFTLSTAFPASGPVTIRITDVSGKVVKQISDNVSRGYMTMQVYQLEKLAPGTYFIEVKQKEITRSTKFVKID
ncbi:MAG: PQQ-dependent sugar dehydrogenase [Bacteroidota bacterium]